MLGLHFVFPVICGGRRPLNGNPKCQRGSYSTRRIAHPHGQPSRSSSLTLRVTMILIGRRPLNSNPTCQRGSYSTRPIAHPHGQPSRIFFANASRYQVLPDGSGYHYLLTLRVTNASLTVRVTSATVTAYFTNLTKLFSALCEI